MTETKELKDAIKAKNKAYKDMKLNNTDENRTNFKNLKINAKKLINQKFKSHLIKQYSNYNNNGKHIWKATKRNLYSSKEEIIDRILHEGRFYQGSKKLRS